MAPILSTFVITLWTLPVLYDTFLGGNCAHDSVNPLLLAIAGLLLIVVGIVSFKLKGSFDNLGLKTELKLAAVTFLIGQIIIESVGNFEENFYLAHGLNSVFSFCLVLISVALPIAMSMERSGGEHHNRLISMKSATNTTGPSVNNLKLKHILKNAQTARKFQKFLEQEFSVENVLFYSELESMHQNPEESPDSTKLLGIVSTFIDENALLQVNLSANVRRAIDVEVETLKKTLLKANSPANDNGSSTAEMPQPFISSATSKLELMTNNA